MSKNIKTFFSGKQYDLVIKYGENSSEVEDKLYVLSAMMILGKELDAINYINSNYEELYKAYPKKTLNAHFELLLKNKLYKDAYKALDNYQELPYVSQEVEEMLRDIKERISEAEHPTNKALGGITEIIEILENSVDNASLSRVLFSLKDYNFNAYKEALEKILTKGDVHPSLRTYALIVMVDNKYNKDVMFLHGKFIKKLNPSKLTPPFMSEVHKAILDEIHNLSMNDISLENTAVQLLNYYLMDIYPNVLKLEDASLTGKAIINLAKKYLNILLKEQDENVNKKMDEIETIINSTPSLEL